MMGGGGGGGKRRKINSEPIAYCKECVKSYEVTVVDFGK